MIDIKDLILNALSDDSVIAPLIHSTSTNPRVYPYYQPAAIIDRDNKAYITFAHTAFPGTERTASADPVYTIAIWGLNWETVETIRDRVVYLFEEKQLTTDDDRVVHGSRLGEHDSFQENTKFAGKNLQFRFAYSKV